MHQTEGTIRIASDCIFFVLITRILGVPGSLTRLEKSSDKKHGSVSDVRSHTKQCCAGDSWSGLIALCDNTVLRSHQAPEQAIQ